MNRRLLLFLALALACLRPLPSAPADVPGLRYEHRKTDLPQSIHVLEVDPHLLRIEAVRALDDGIGRETVSSIAQRKGAVAAVNAGFFTIGGRYDGEPNGILKIGPNWYSDTDVARGAIGWTQDGRVARIGRLSLKWSLQSHGSSWPIDGINRARGAAEAILYSWAFHRSTLTDPDGSEFLISRNRIIGVSRQGNAPIPMDGFVYSLGPQTTVPVAGLKVNAKVQVAYQFGASDPSDAADKPAWPAMTYIVGGKPALLLKRQSTFESNDEKMSAGFMEERHPRTAVGLRADGTWVFVIVDGRQSQLSIGITLKELTEILQSLNCVDALNLDGGGSSTLYYQGQVVNSPSDATKERPVSDAIVILPAANTNRDRTQSRSLTEPGKIR